jgi:hypothetical protein
VLPRRRSIGLFGLSLLALAVVASVDGALAQSAAGLRLPGEDPTESDLAAPDAADDIVDEVDTSPISAPKPKRKKPVAAPPTTLEIKPPADLEPDIVPPPPPPPRLRKVEEPYAPQGIPMGAFRLFPVLETGAAFSDNPGQTHGRRKSDIGLRLKPAFALRSDWARHSFEANGDGDLIFYMDEPDFNSDSAHADARLRLDVRRTTTFDLRASYDLSQDSAGNREVPDSAIGFRTDHDVAATAELVHRAGRIETRLKAGADIRIFEDVKLAGGGKEDNGDRNYIEPNVALRLGYETSAAIRPFIEIAYRPRVHDRQFDRNGLRRDSNGFTESLGAAFDLDTIWSGEAALVYVVRDYDDPALKTVDAFGVTANLVWRPTRLTVLSLNAATTISDSSSASEGGTRNYDVSLDASHEMRENLTLRAGAGFNYDDSRSGADDKTYTADAGFIYRFNPWVAWTAGYEFTYFDSGSPASDYTENRVTTGIEFRR